MLKALRAELQSLLREAAVTRPPALRRALTDQALFATDLPQCTDSDTVQVWIRRAETMGWQVMPEGGWLLLDYPITPTASPPSRLPPGELGCCISLLQRHLSDETDPVWARRLLKAAEAGVEPQERVCRALHLRLAELLRAHLPLPAQMLPLLYALLEVNP